MKNIDKIRNMSAEELADCIKGNSCRFCSYRQDFKKCNEVICREAIAEWLEQDIKPMPKLQKGDLIEFGSGKEVVYFENDFVWDFLKGNGVILTNMTEVDYKRIVSVRRANERKQVNVIWQGGM